MVTNTSIPRIRGRVAEIGIYHGDLARRLGMHRTLLSAIIAGRRNAPVGFASRAHAMLDLLERAERAANEARALVLTDAAISEASRVAEPERLARLLDRLSRNERELRLHLARIADSSLTVHTSYRQAVKHLPWLSVDTYSQACRRLVRKGLLTRIRQGTRSYPSIFTITQWKV